MIVGKRQIVHGTNDDFAVDHDRALLGGMNAQNGRLRRIDDGSGKHRAENAAVAHGKRAAGKFFDQQLARLSTLGKVGNFKFYFGKSFLIGVSHHGNHQTALRTDGNANVKIAVVDDVGAVDRSVQNRELFERINGGLDKERHETQLDAVASLELFLVSGTQRDDRAHVHFVEGGELRGTGKALNQTLCHTTAQTRHRNSILLAAVRIGRDRFGRRRRRSRPRSRNRSRRRFGSLRLNRRFSCRKRINLGNTVSRSSTDHGLGVNAGSGKNGGC